MKLIKVCLILFLLLCPIVWASSVYFNPIMGVSIQNGTPTYSMYGFYVTQGFNCNHGYYDYPYCGGRPPRITPRPNPVHFYHVKHHDFHRP